MAVLRFLDIAGAHLTDLDVELLDEGSLPTDSIKYGTGWIVSTAHLIHLAAREDYVSKFREHGMSEAFIAAARKAAENDCWLLRFEVDADIDEDLEVGGYVD